MGREARTEYVGFSALFQLAFELRIPGVRGDHRTHVGIGGVCHSLAAKHEADGAVVLGFWDSCCVRCEILLYSQASQFFWLAP